jgi:hypothetical protein
MRSLFAAELFGIQSNAIFHGRHTARGAWRAVNPATLEGTGVAAGFSPKWSCEIRLLYADVDRNISGQGDEPWAGSLRPDFERLLSLQLRHLIGAYGRLCRKRAHDEVDAEARRVFR